MIAIAGLRGLQEHERWRVPLDRGDGPAMMIGSLPDRRSPRPGRLRYRRGAEDVAEEPGSGVGHPGQDRRDDREPCPGDVTIYRWRGDERQCLAAPIATPLAPSARPPVGLLTWQGLVVNSRWSLLLGYHKQPSTFGPALLVVSLRLRWSSYVLTDILDRRRRLERKTEFRPHPSRPARVGSHEPWNGTGVPGLSGRIFPTRAAPLPGGGPRRSARDGRGRDRPTPGRRPRYPR